MSENWYLWNDAAHDAYTNMAIDEALLLTANERDLPLLRLYEWNEDAVSIGYVQKIAKVPDDRGKIVRRPTGGGIVYHKHHFTYTVVLPNDHWIVKDNKPIISYSWLNKAVQAALQQVSLQSQLATEDIPKSVDRASMVCFVTPTKYDLLEGKRKIAGSAQRRTNSGMLHQGSIEMENLTVLNAKTLRQVLPQGFTNVLNCAFVDFQPSASLLELASSLNHEKYSTTKWNAKW